MNTEFYTLDEIRNQADLWEDTFNRYLDLKEELDQFLDDIYQKHGRVRVIFTGAGTSQYVGDTIYPELKNNNEKYDFYSIATTDIVSNPNEYLINEPTILVSFARSGNSPESVATVKKAYENIDDLYEVVITCAEEGKLAVNTRGNDKAFLFLLNEKTNDRGFAMTSSFTDMALAALLTFEDRLLEEKQEICEIIVDAARNVIKREEEIEEITKNYDYERVVYTGSGSLSGLSREAQLKILELTAGEIATVFDSSMGFRHGPKSFINNKTIFFNFVSKDEYTSQYDRDILNEVKNDEIATLTMAIGEKVGSIDSFEIEANVPDGYLSIVYIIFAQFFAAYTAIKVGNDVDHPSKSQTVNRVVKGVTIH
ncbi:MAG: SIS domain-containing protein [Tissierellia bacterium]|nr:SIS domain-containing protein [Tissierellia bacterium]